MEMTLALSHGTGGRRTPPKGMRTERPPAPQKGRKTETTLVDPITGGGQRPPRPPIAEEDGDHPGPTAKGRRTETPLAPPIVKRDGDHYGSSKDKKCSDPLGPLKRRRTENPPGQGGQRPTLTPTKVKRTETPSQGPA